MNAFLNKYRPSFRASTFFVGYITVFMLLLLFGYMSDGRIGIVEHATLFVRQRFHSDMGYLPLPRMDITLTAAGGGGNENAPRLRMEIVLEVAHKDQEVIAGYQPGMCEKINAFVLDMKPEQLQEKNAIAWLRTALLKQVNAAGSPAPVHDLYFQQFIVM